MTLFAQRGYHGTTMNDIAKLLGLRAPSLYNHIASKQEILRDIMLQTETELLAEFHAATDGIDGVTERLHRAVKAFVLHHALHRREALIGNREVASLEEPARSYLLQMRRQHERSIRAIIEEGRANARFTLTHPHLASFAMLEMGVSVARWFRDDGPLSAEEVAEQYGMLAVQMCGCAAAAPHES
ncbi:MAG: TetR/AcrR family transcriptional regulator [Streptosporangiaceae bacterium]